MIATSRVEHLSSKFLTADTIEAIVPMEAPSPARKRQRIVTIYIKKSNSLSMVKANPAQPTKEITAPMI